ncbi:hypothetical protein [Microbacterium azadirachtae]|uniref:Uncharacterized protein n=1 Tax=Microbacterium azadirachtae TaxID=582680 RepID=A0A0F0LVK8_9MICO|nr:hypothetical protein [Microbacterium azadirachtae]KJL35471.1 hypothetical protein RS86_00467 [Microbacterium azadirachtae]
MNRTLAAAPLALVGALLFAGCAPTPPAATPTPTATVERAIAAADIKTIDDGIAWAHGLDKTVSATELSHGINAISDLVPKLDIWFATNNKIGQALTKLNAEVLAAPANASSKVDGLNDIVNEIEKAIAKGDAP